MNTIFSPLHDSTHTQTHTQTHTRIVSFHFNVYYAVILNRKWSVSIRHHPLNQLRYYTPGLEFSNGSKHIKTDIKSLSDQLPKKKLMPASIIKQSSMLFGH